MNKNDGDSVWTRTINAGQNRLKQFTKLWSIQTLTDLPDRLNNLWQWLIGSYWFIPTACVIVGILLAPLLVAIDQHFDRETVKEISFAFTGDDEAARAAAVLL